MRVLVLSAVTLAALVSVAHAKPPEPPTEVAVVETGPAPCGLAAFGGELWVGVYEAGTVLRLDRAGRVQHRHRVGRWACQIAVDARAAWVTRDNADEVVRIDGRSGRLTWLRIASPLGVALAAGAAWVTSFETGTVTRIDARTGRVTRRWSVGGHPTGVTVCGGKVWVGHGRTATWLTSLDPRTGMARRFDVVVPTPRWPRCIDGELWVTTEDSLLRVSPRTGELRAHFQLGGTPAEAGLAASAIGGPRTIWVTDKERSVVHRVDPGSGHVFDSFPAGPGALAQARFGGSVWISSFAGSDVRRYDP
jgi:outer membrane protein assembly factor BamB